MRKLIVVQCGQMKIWKHNPELGIVEAKDAYISPYFKKGRAYAEKFGDKWVILSAKYGFLDPNEKINDYNVSFKRKNPAPIPLSKLREQVLAKRLNEFDEVIVLGGEEYLRAVRESFSGSRCKVISPFGGLRIGERLSALNEALGINKSKEKVFFLWRE